MAISGQGRMDLCALVTEPIDLNTLAERVRTDASGAVAVFTGVVRDHHHGKRVVALDYEAYAPMAVEEMHRIAAEIRTRWDLEGIAMVHRTGYLEIGETSVAVAVASAHRREALDACAYAIDRLKESVPIWKKEYGEAGGSWIIRDARARRARLIPFPDPKASSRRRVKA